MKVVLVKWLDAYSMEEWLSKAELESKLRDQPRGALTVTPGIVYKETEDALVLVQNFQDETEEAEADFSGVMFIPKGMIQEIKVLSDD